MADPRHTITDSTLSIPNSQFPIASFCLLTPPGRGAIATVGVRGAGAIDLVARHFQPASGKQLTAIPFGRALFGRFQMTSTLARSASEGNAAPTSEDLIIGLIAPEELEINCHGGNAAAQAICEALAANGAVRIAAELWAGQQQVSPLSSEA